MEPTTMLDVGGPIAVAAVYCFLSGFIREPARQQFNAVMIAGAGAAYFNGGLGPWELAFATLMVPVAFMGLKSYRYIGLGWLLHTCWDVMHHRYGTPIIPFVPDSSFGCAICDPFIALWCFAGAPSLLRNSESRVVNASGAAG